MRIKVTSERNCCEMQDLKELEGSPKVGRYSEIMFCMHCGHRHKYTSFIDAAGGRDFRYEKIKEGN